MAGYQLPASGLQATKQLPAQPATGVAGNQTASRGKANTKLLVSLSNRIGRGGRVLKSAREKREMWYTREGWREGMREGWDVGDDKDNTTGERFCIDGCSCRADGNPNGVKINCCRCCNCLSPIPLLPQ